jgi:predicted RNA-binding protein with RPS1 domain
MWWKLDDHRVSEVEWKIVLVEAQGGSELSMRTASNLVYVSEATRQQLIESKQEQYNFEKAWAKYGNLPVAQTIVQTNKQFKEDLKA